VKITQQQINRIKQFRREIYRDEGEEEPKIAGLFARGHYSIVASPAGVGKTWLTEHLICQLSTGDSCLGGISEPEQPRKILLLAGETGTKLINQRLAKTNWGYEPENISIYSALELAKNDIPYMLNTPEGRDTISTIMQAEKPDIVFIDTLISWHLADESKQADMSEIYIYLLRLADFFKCAVVINHHTRKMPSANMKRELEQDDVIGTGAGVRFARDVYILMRQKDNSILIKNPKSWDKKAPKISFRIISDGEYLDLGFRLEEYNGSLTEQFEEFVTNLPDNALLTTMQVSNQFNISTQLARYHITNMIREGKLIEVTFCNQKAYQKPGRTR